MKFMRVLVACAACLGAGTPVFAEKIPLAAIESYIESITTARGTFEQINPDKSRVTGQLILKRPWRARFDYDAPVNSSVIAAAGSLTIVDGKSDSKQVYPLNKTPLVHLLRPNVDLSTTTDVVAHTYNGRHTIVTMVDRNNLEAGQIHLVFDDLIFHYKLQSDTKNHHHYLYPLFPIIIYICSVLLPINYSYL